MKYLECTFTQQRKMYDNGKKKTNKIVKMFL